MRARLEKRGKSAVSNLISPVEGLRGNEGMSRRRETVGVLIYLHTHQQNYRSMKCKHTHTLIHCTHAAGKLSTCSSLCKRVAWVSTPLL